MPLQGCRVLVVEDDFLISEHICETIINAGGQIVGPFITVAHALEHMNELDGVDVAVLDVGLVNETTYPLAAALQTTRIPVLFVTGLARGDLPSQFLSACYLQKPFTEDGLVAGIVDCYGTVRR